MMYVVLSLTAEFLHKGVRDSFYLNLVMENNSQPFSLWHKNIWIHLSKKKKKSFLEETFFYWALPFTQLLMMISCSHPSSHHSERGWDLEAIIWAEESLCSARLLLLHIATQNTNTFFPVYWICWPPTPQQFSITLAPTPLGIQMQELEQVLSQESLSSSRLICLLRFPSGHTGYSLGAMQLSGSWRKLSQNLVGPLAFSLDLLLLSPLLTLDHCLYSLNLPCP